MTPIEFQDALAEEIRHILKPYAYKNPDGERVSVNVYTQSIPVQQVQQVNLAQQVKLDQQIKVEEDPYPYVIVRLHDGANPLGKDSFNTVSVTLIIGIWDDAQDAQGHRDVMNIVQKIYERFSENPCLSNLAAYTGDFQWMLQEDNYYPYNLGACYMKFNIAAVRREDTLA